MSKQELKSSKLPVFLITMLMVHLVIFPIYMFSLVAWPDSLIFKVITPIFFLVLGTDLVMLFNLGAFTYDYSVLGRYKRTPLPDEAPILKQRGRFGRVGYLWMTSPLITWILYPSGLGIIMFGVGKAFIPIKNIVEVKVDKTFPYPFWPPYEVLHNSPELNNPIILPNRKLFDTLQQTFVNHQ